MRILCTLWFGFIFLSCSGAKVHHENSRQLKTKRSHAVGTFVAGPEVNNTRELIKWLSGQGHAGQGVRRVLRVPVTIHWRKEPGQLPSIEAYITTSEPVGASERLMVRLDGTALGIPICNRVRMLCPEPATTCTVWLEGYWGPLVLSAQVQRQEPVLSVLRVVGAVDSTERSLRVYFRQN